MTCPRCGIKMFFEWAEPWFDYLKDEAFTDKVYHCDNCDYDILQTVDENNEEVKIRRYFFG